MIEYEDRKSTKSLVQITYRDSRDCTVRSCNNLFPSSA